MDRLATPSKFRVRNLAIAGVMITCSLVLAGCGAINRLIDTALNPVSLPPPYTISDDVAEFHESLFIADLHADSLLWQRDLLEKQSEGHVDIPRLLEGNVALQAFTVVTSVPIPYGEYYSRYAPDVITPFSILQRRPHEAWSRLKARAIDQARDLHEFAEQSNGRLILIETRRDLERYVQRRKSNPSLDITAAFLGLEGAHALEGDLGNLQELFAHGFRMLSLTHFFDNAYAGSSTGYAQQHPEDDQFSAGLTPLGIDLIRALDRYGMILDLSHASRQTIDEILDFDPLPPLVVSHTGVMGTCPKHIQNLSDRHVVKVAQHGGLIGIGLYKSALCGNHISDTAKTIEYVVDLLRRNGIDGANHVALGSDFDGAIHAHVDATGLVLLTQTLVKCDTFSKDDVEKIMGGNVRDFLVNHLPEK